MPRRATSTSFKPGQTGNPKGRPKGSLDIMPKVRDLVNGVLTGHHADIAEAVRRAAVNPRSVMAFVETAARLNREIGPGQDGGDQGVKVIFVGGPGGLDTRPFLEAAQRAKTSGGGA